MSYATVPAYHVFMAAKMTMENYTGATKHRIEPASQLDQSSEASAKLKEINDRETVRALAVGRLMNLAVAASSVHAGAMVALDGFDLDLIKEPFFDPQVMTTARNERLFAATPGGHA